MSIHPFVDGNGRTARLLANLILLQGGYPIVVLRVEDRARYYAALEVSHTGDLTPFLDLFLDRLADSVAEYERAVEEYERQQQRT